MRLWVCFGLRDWVMLVLLSVLSALGTPLWMMSWVVGFRVGDCFFVLCGFLACTDMCGSRFSLLVVRIKEQGRQQP